MSWDRKSPRQQQFAMPNFMIDSARSSVQSARSSMTAGLDESQMIQEARYRIAYNKQRSQLRNLLRCVADDKGTVRGDQLQLAANLAGFELPSDVSSKLASPRRLYVKPIVSSLELPPLQGFAPTPRAQTTTALKTEPEYTPPPGYNLERIDPAVREGWAMLKAKCETNFSMLKSAFRRVDADKSGKLNAFEVHKVLHEFNAGLSHKVIDQLISVADYDGDGEINWLEFVTFIKRGAAARVPDNAAEMLAKQSETRAAARRQAQEEARRQEIRTCQRLIAQRIETNFGSTNLSQAFRQIDEDKSGTLDLQEIQRLLFNLNLVPDMVSPANLQTILKMADFDGDGNINYAEFARLITANDVLQLKKTLTAADETTDYSY